MKGWDDCDKETYQIFVRTSGLAEVEEFGQAQKLGLAIVGVRSLHFDARLQGRDGGYHGRTCV